MRRLLFLLVIAALWPAVAIADWADRPDPVWQDADVIHARGRGSTAEGAAERARDALKRAVAASLPDLDPDVVARSAVIGERRTEGDWTIVRLDFHAANGKACSTPKVWFDRAMKALTEGSDTRAAAALAQAAWRAPGEVGILDALGLHLANLGFWGSSAMLYDAAAAAFDEPPLTLMRSRITVHLWMGDKAGANVAVDALREYDPIDEELRTLESLVFSMEPTPLRLIEQEVMPLNVETYDAELAVRFAVWALMDEDTRGALVERDLRRGDVEQTVTLGGIRFQGLRGHLAGDDVLEVRDRDDRAWTVTVTPGPAGVSCLAQASRFEAPESLPADRLHVGGLFPIEDPAGGARLDEGWLVPVYYVDETSGEDRIQLQLLLRWGDRTAVVAIDGAMGEERRGRPGLLTCPELVQMLVSTAHPRKGETS
jgi:hypothetical protein